MLCGSTDRNTKALCAPAPSGGRPLEYPSATRQRGEECLGNTEQFCQALARHAAGPDVTRGMHSQRLCGTIGFELPMRFL